MTDPRITATIAYWQDRAGAMEGSDPCANCTHSERCHIVGSILHMTACQVIVSESLGCIVTCDCMRYDPADDQIDYPA